MWSSLKQFYKSKEWIIFRKLIILDRGPICQKCGKKIVESKHIIVHHIIELTEENVNDTSISLNPDNVIIVCFDCHNKIHERFGYGYKAPKKKERGISIVFGPPCSGKTKYVIDNMTRGDIVVDMDRLYQAVTLLPLYDKPNNLKQNVTAVRNQIIDNVKTRYGRFNSAWIIGGYPDKYKREKLACDLGAELIFIQVDKEDCLYRLKYTNDYRQYHYEEWKGYIDKWFMRYTA